MNDSQWNYLGLSHNPFSDPQQEFFPGADREPMLAKIRKLSAWSRPILAVTGPHGVGKTCVFRALSSSLEAGVVAARVNGSLVSRAGDVLSALVQGYGVAAPIGAEAPLLTELVIAHLQDQTQNDRTSLVLVDDAHLLEQRAVDDLVNLADAGAKLAFFSEPQFIESLQRAVERNAETSDGDELLWQEMLLSPFSRDQSGEYLEWRFAEAGYNGRMPFSEHQVDLVHKASLGYPGRLDFAANEQLMIMTLGGSGSVGLPRKHIWLAGGIAAALALTVLFWSPSEDAETDLNDADADSKTVELDMPGATGDERSAAEDPGNDKPDNKPGDRQTASRDSLNADSADAVVPISRTIKPIPSSERPVPEPAANQSRTIRPVPVPEPEPEQPKPAEQPTVAQTAPAETTPAETTPAETTPAETTTAEARVDPPVVASEVQDVEVIPEVRQVQGVRDAAWLLRQSESSYTLQLIGFGDIERATAYLGEQADPSRFALFRIRSGERVVHVVTYGVYDSQADAESAATNLPGSVGKVTPWVRPVRSVKDAITAAPELNSFN